MFSRQIFLVFRYQPMIEELADIILSADIDTVEAVQRRYGEQVPLIRPSRSALVSFVDFVQFLAHAARCMSRKDRLDQQ